MRDQPLVLRPFDAATVAPGTALRANVTRDGTLLTLHWMLDAPPGTVMMPARSIPPAQRDRLWDSTCCEAFLAPARRAEYWEVNSSPSGDWNVYRFDGERTGMRPEPRVAAPSIATSTDTGGRITVTATLDLAPLPELATTPLDVAVTAVLQATDGTRSYWSVRHTRSQPDFHARDGFVVRLG